MTVLREDLLAGRTIAVAGPVRSDVRDALVGQGGAVKDFDPGCTSEDERAQEWVRVHAPLHGLVHDTATPFGAGGEAGLLAALQDAWVAVAAVANGAMIPAETGGKVVLLGPHAKAGPHAHAVRSALENLARTLSVEWARYGITTVAISPGPASSDQDVAELVTFLVSPAGDYFSGCTFALGARPPAPLIRAY
jgi:NAD(P)-dependent dehydrogenase (short-subunit alcohol dehydrogenase family)